MRVLQLKFAVKKVIATHKIASKAGDEGGGPERRRSFVDVTEATIVRRRSQANIAEPMSPPSPSPSVGGAGAGAGAGGGEGTEAGGGGGGGGGGGAAEGSMSAAKAALQAPSRHTPARRRSVSGVAAASGYKMRALATPAKVQLESAAAAQLVNSVDSASMLKASTGDSSRVTMADVVMGAVSRVGVGLRGARGLASSLKKGGGDALAAAAAAAAVLKGDGGGAAAAGAGAGAAPATAKVHRRESFADAMSAFRTRRMLEESRRRRTEVDAIADASAVDATVDDALQLQFKEPAHLHTLAALGRARPQKYKHKFFKSVKKVVEGDGAFGDGDDSDDSNGSFGSKHGKAVTAEELDRKRLEDRQQLNMEIAGAVASSISGSSCCVPTQPTPHPPYPSLFLSSSVSPLNVNRGVQWECPGIPLKSRRTGCCRACRQASRLRCSRESLLPRLALSSMSWRCRRHSGVESICRRCAVGAGCHRRRCTRRRKSLLAARASPTTFAARC